jgi:putative peptide zinc metalloprotease protein
MSVPTRAGVRAPARAPGIELLGELSGSGYHEAPGLVRRGDGQTVQVTPLLYALLDSLDGQRGLPQLAEELGRRVGKTVAPEDVQYLLENKLEPLGLLGDPDGAAPHVQKSTPLLGLKLKVVVSDPAVTRRLTTPFAWLFRSWVVVPVLVAFAVTCWWVLWEQGLASATRQAFDSPGLLLAVFVITVLSAGWHEFGHAAACRAAGAAPGAMGAGLYLVWPAFYTDVDDSYRLSRWGRLVVDLGGLYFNALVAVGVTGLWLVVRQDALLLVVATQLLLMLRQLAPIIRADGYHILADLTGVPDLFQHIQPTLAGLLPQNWGKPQPLRRWARWVVRAWVLVVVPLLLWMLLLAVLLLPRLVATAWTGLQEQGPSRRRCRCAEGPRAVAARGRRVVPAGPAGPQQRGRCLDPHPRAPGSPRPLHGGRRCRARAAGLGVVAVRAVRAGARGRPRHPRPGAAAASGVLRAAGAAQRPDDARTRPRPSRRLRARAAPRPAGGRRAAADGRHEQPG